MNRRSFLKSVLGSLGLGVLQKVFGVFGFEQPPEEIITSISRSSPLLMDYDLTLGFWPDTHIGFTGSTGWIEVPDLGIHKWINEYMEKSESE